MISRAVRQDVVGLLLHTDGQLQEMQGEIQREEGDLEEILERVMDELLDLLIDLSDVVEVLPHWVERRVAQRLAGTMDAQEARRWGAEAYASGTTVTQADFAAYLAGRFDVDVCDAQLQSVASYFWRTCGLVWVAVKLGLESSRTVEE